MNCQFTKNIENILHLILGCVSVCAWTIKRKPLKLVKLRNHWLPLVWPPTSDHFLYRCVQATTLAWHFELLLKGGNNCNFIARKSIKQGWDAKSTTQIISNIFIADKSVKMLTHFMVHNSFKHFKIPGLSMTFKCFPGPVSNLHLCYLSICFSDLKSLLLFGSTV